MKLCESVNVFARDAMAKPGTTADFAIWLSSSGGDSGGVAVTLATSPTAATHFTVCPSGHTKTCKLTKVGAGQSFELQAAVTVPTSSTNGEQVRLTARATSAKPKATVKAWAAVTVSVPPAPAPSHRSAAGAGATNAGGSASSTTGTFPLSNTSLPLVATSPSGIGGNIGSLLPSIPAVTPTPSAAPASTARAAQAASIGPLDRRLMGTQLIALAALCAAIGIVIARMTLRTPKPAPSVAQAATGGGSSTRGGSTAVGGSSAGLPSASASQASASASDAASAATKPEPPVGTAKDG